MATVTFWTNFFTDTIPVQGPDEGHGIFYFWLEHPLYGQGAATVTCVAQYAPDRLLEVVQTATRGSYDGNFYLDIVVRNNGSVEVDGFHAYTSIISP